MSAVENTKATLLIVEDDIDVADMLNAYFRTVGYEVLTVNWGEDGVRACQTSRPDLIILDIRLPDIDGFEVARRLRENRRTREIPIIFLTEKRERADRLKGLQLSADDYITKPFDIQELRLRVRNTLSRASRGSLTNTITGMPEGQLVDEKLNLFLTSKNNGLLLISLKRFEAFRETYGFVAADDLLRAITIMMRDVLAECSGSEDDFFGHLTTTDFVLIARAAQLAVIKEKLVYRLEQSFEYFYRDQDRNTESFRNRRLTVKITEILPDANRNSDLNRFKVDLERIYRQES
jgi:DNA-binding response OmpR family regulator